MTTSEPRYNVSLSSQFNQDGVPKRPQSAYAYSTGWQATSVNLVQLADHITTGGAWSGVTIEVHVKEPTSYRHRY